tara:strand:- start:61 stop:246 length:186 start_codon:yes stop_codon:yes gene_type:complete
MLGSRSTKDWFMPSSKFFKRYRDGFHPDPNDTQNRGDVTHRKSSKNELSSTLCMDVGERSG